MSVKYSLPKGLKFQSLTGSGVFPQTLHFTANENDFSQQRFTVFNNMSLAQNTIFSTKGLNGQPTSWLFLPSRTVILSGFNGTFIHPEAHVLLPTGTKFADPVSPLLVNSSSVIFTLPKSISYDVKNEGSFKPGMFTLPPNTIYLSTNGLGILRDGAKFKVKQEQSKPYTLETATVFEPTSGSVDSNSVLKLPEGTMFTQGYSDVGLGLGLDVSTTFTLPSTVSFEDRKLHNLVGQEPVFYLEGFNTSGSYNLYRKSNNFTLFSLLDQYSIPIGVSFLNGNTRGTLNQPLVFTVSDYSQSKGFLSNVILPYILPERLAFTSDNITLTFPRGTIFLSNFDGSTLNNNSKIIMPKGTVYNSKLTNPPIDMYTAIFSPPDVTYRANDNFGDFIFPVGMRYVTKTSTGSLDEELQFIPPSTLETGKVSTFHSLQQNVILFPKVPTGYTGAQEIKLPRKTLIIGGNFDIENIRDGLSFLLPLNTLFLEKAHSYEDYTVFSLPEGILYEGYYQIDKTNGIGEIFTLSPEVLYSNRQGSSTVEVPTSFSLKPNDVTVDSRLISKPVKLETAIEYRSVERADINNVILPPGTTILRDGNTDILFSGVTISLPNNVIFTDSINQQKLRMAIFSTPINITYTSYVNDISKNGNESIIFKFPSGTTYMTPYTMGVLNKVTTFTVTEQEIEPFLTNSNLFTLDRDITYQNTGNNEPSKISFTLPRLTQFVRGGSEGTLEVSAAFKLPPGTTFKANDRIRQIGFDDIFTLPDTFVFSNAYSSRILPPGSLFTLPDGVIHKTSVTSERITSNTTFFTPSFNTVRKPTKVPIQAGKIIMDDGKELHIGPDDELKVHGATFILQNKTLYSNGPDSITYTTGHEFLLPNGTFFFGKTNAVVKGEATVHSQGERYNMGNGTSILGALFSPQIDSRFITPIGKSAIVKGGVITLPKNTQISVSNGPIITSNATVTVHNSQRIKRATIKNLIKIENATLTLQNGASYSNENDTSVDGGNYTLSGAAELDNSGVTIVTGGVITLPNGTVIVSNGTVLIEYGVFSLPKGTYLEIDGNASAIIRGGTFTLPLKTEFIAAEGDNSPKTTLTEVETSDYSAKAEDIEKDFYVYVDESGEEQDLLRVYVMSKDGEAYPKDEVLRLLATTCDGIGKQIIYCIYLTK